MIWIDCCCLPSQYWHSEAQKILYFIRCNTIATYKISDRLFELEVYICTTEEQLNKLKCIAEVLEKGSFNHMNTKNKIMKKKNI